jgi:hypothetical protein
MATLSHQTDEETAALIMAEGFEPSVNLDPEQQGMVVGMAHIAWVLADCLRRASGGV